MSALAHRARRLVRTELLGLPYLVFAAVGLFVPLGVLALYSFWRAGFLTIERELTLDSYTELLGSGAYWDLLARSLAVGLVSAALITVLAFTLCHGIVFRFPRAKFVLFGLVIGASLASFMGRVLAARTLLGDGGVINYALVALGITSGPVGLLGFGYPTIVLTLTYVWLPTAALILFGSLNDVSRQTLEASHDLGAARWETLWRVTVPQAAPGIKAAFALMFIVSTADYITPSLVGGTRGALYASGMSSAFLNEGDLPRGSAMAFVLILAMTVTIAVVFGLTKLLTRGVSAYTGSVLARRLTARTVRRSWLDWSSLSKLATFPILAFQLVPIATIVLFSLNAAPVVGLPITGLTTRWYSEVVATPGFGGALRTSLLIMVLDVAGSVSLGVLLAIAIARRGVRRGVLFILLPLAVAAPIVVPRTVIGVAYYSSTLLFQIPLGIAVTVVAQILLSAPFVGIVLSLRLAGVDPHIAEAARDLGARSWYRTRTITLPMMLPSIVGVAFMVAAFSMDEILVTTFTIGANSTLPVWMLSQARNGMTPGINAVAAILLLATVGLLALAAVSRYAFRIRLRRRQPDVEGDRLTAFA